MSAKHTPVVVIRLENEVGTPVKWRVWRDGRHPAAWMLEDHIGTIRTLESVWSTAVPKIRLIAENYNLKFLQEIN